MKLTNYSIDIDECMETNDCVEGAICQNLLGRYNCSCPPGYEGDGKKGDGKNTGTGCSKKLSTKQRKDIILIIALSEYNIFFFFFG
jgi:hypothetical protein